jgi:hygromycin-B 7''-O-kinase
VTGPPAFASLDDYVARRVEVDVWWPYLREIVARLGLEDAGTEAVPGANPTWPTFVYGDVVVKLFGYQPSWRRAFTTERSALALVGGDPEILAPRIVGEGQTFDEPDAWPFLVMTRTPGRASWPDGPAPDRWPTIAAELGRQVRRLHELQPSGVATEHDWPDADVRSAVARSSLPPHLAAQAADYVAALPPSDEVFNNGDLAGQHVFVQEGHLTGLIDWGDAMVTDRHCELIQIYRDTFDCDAALLRVFLDASAWPVTEDFPRLAMGQALRRQAFMLAQHPTGDVFMPIAERFPLQEIATLDDLAIELFGS